MLLIEVLLLKMTMVAAKKRRFLRGCVSQQGPSNLIGVSQELDLCMLGPQFDTISISNGHSHLVGGGSILQLSCLHEDIHVLSIDEGWNQGAEYFCFLR